jgi:hypothetical protein
LVTQWRSTVAVSVGSAWTSSHVHETGLVDGAADREVPLRERPMTTSFESRWCPTPSQLKEVHATAAAEFGRPVVSS